MLTRVALRPAVGAVGSKTRQERKRVQRGNCGRCVRVGRNFRRGRESGEGMPQVSVFCEADLSHSFGLMYDS